MASNPTIACVIPCLNEEGSVGQVLTSLPDAVTQVIVVDGDSQDETIAVIRATRPDTHIIVERARGKGIATITGVLHSTSDFTILLDGDGSMDPLTITKMELAFLSGAQVVHASRELRGAGSTDFSIYRRIGNKCLTFAANRICGIGSTDITYGYLGLSRSAIEQLDLHQLLGERQSGTGAVTEHRWRPADHGWGFEIEVLILARAALRGLSIIEVPSFEFARTGGKTKLHPVRDGLRILRTIIIEQWASREALKG